jgi:hypothetical protein
MFRDGVPASMEQEKPGHPIPPSDSGLINHSTTILLVFPPAPKPQTSADVVAAEDSRPEVATQGGPRSFMGFVQGFVSALASFLSSTSKGKAVEPPLGDMEYSDSESEKTQPGAPHTYRHQPLKAVPFTLERFQMIAQRMSVHSWITRLINRADVPAFDRTWTEMPLYSGSGENMGAQKAIRGFLNGLKCLQKNELTIPISL